MSQVRAVLRCLPFYPFLCGRAALHPFPVYVSYLPCWRSGRDERVAGGYNSGSCTYHSEMMGRQLVMAGQLAQIPIARLTGGSGLLSQLAVEKVTHVYRNYDRGDVVVFRPTKVRKAVMPTGPSCHRAIINVEVLSGSI